MRISEYFHLQRRQPELDFIDVDVKTDLKVFIDPRALRLYPTEMGPHCVHLVQSFFRKVLVDIKDGNDNSAKNLLRMLKEPNETHLGLSKKESRGRALGYESAGDVWEALSKSEAARTGLLEDLEDTILMVEGISSDIVSDITTNIIRLPLIEYTQRMCVFYGIPLENDVDSGPLWDSHENEWYSQYVSLPKTNDDKLLLVPKAMVRRKLDYDQDEYYRHHILEFLKIYEQNANSELVKLLKDGRKNVTKKALIEKYGKSKQVIVEQTLAHPEILRGYRTIKSRKPRGAMNHLELSREDALDIPNWNELMQNVKDVPPGKENATAYENAIEQLLSVLFYPSLVNPIVQHEIHQGRKRIDITYTNVAQEGFFYWLSLHYPSSQIFVECKNYGKEVGNPELDQISSRFSPNRGKIGLLICRKFYNKKRFIQGCIDTCNDQRGYVIALDDNDLSELIPKEENDFRKYQDFMLLMDRFRSLIN